MEDDADEFPLNAADHAMAGVSGPGWLCCCSMFPPQLMPVDQGFAQGVPGEGSATVATSAGAWAGTSAGLATATVIHVQGSEENEDEDMDLEWGAPMGRGSTGKRKAPPADVRKHIQESFWVPKPKTGRPSEAPAAGL